MPGRSSSVSWGTINSALLPLLKKIPLPLLDPIDDTCLCLADCRIAGEFDPELDVSVDGDLLNGAGGGCVKLACLINALCLANCLSKSVLRASVLHIHSILNCLHAGQVSPIILTFLFLTATSLTFNKTLIVGLFFRSNEGIIISSQCGLLRARRKKRNKRPTESSWAEEWKKVRVAF